MSQKWRIRIFLPVLYFNAMGIFFIQSRLQMIGAMLITIGGGMNGLAIFGNGGKMPVRGRDTANDSHQPETEQTRYRPLIDRIPRKKGVCSIGDILLQTGIAFMIVGLIATLISAVSHYL